MTATRCSANLLAVQRCASCRFAVGQCQSQAGRMPGRASDVAASASSRRCCVRERLGGCRTDGPTGGKICAVEEIGLHDVHAISPPERGQSRRGRYRRRTRQFPKSQINRWAIVRLKTMRSASSPFSRQSDGWTRSRSRLRSRARSWVSVPARPSRSMTKQTRTGCSRRFMRNATSRSDRSARLGIPDSIPRTEPDTTRA